MERVVFFVLGIAAFSCMTQVVRSAANGRPGMIFMGGFVFMLPVLIRDAWEAFPRPCDLEVVPEPDQFEPGLVARALALTHAEVFSAGRPLRIRLNAVRGRRGDWQPYEIRFRRQERDVYVESLGRPRRGAGALLVSEWVPEHEATVRVGADGACVLSLRLEGTRVISRNHRFRLRPGGWLRLTQGQSFRVWTVGWLALVVLVWNLAGHAGVTGGLAAARYYFWVGLVPLGLARMVFKVRADGNS